MNDFNKLESGSRSPHTLHYLVWRFLPRLLIIIMIEHILSITMLTIKILFTIPSVKKPLVLIRKNSFH